MSEDHGYRAHSKGSISHLMTYKTGIVFSDIMSIPNFTNKLPSHSLVIYARGQWCHLPLENHGQRHHDEGTSFPPNEFEHIILVLPIEFWLASNVINFHTTFYENPISHSQVIVWQNMQLVRPPVHGSSISLSVDMTGRQTELAHKAFFVYVTA